MCQKDGILVDSELHQDLVAIVVNPNKLYQMGVSENSFGNSRSKPCRTKIPDKEDGTH